ncbi:uncharacterized protein METZ01_LOCUS480510 [marine metagenome]|uniref:Uncharacterized protein n=1 Tax=marine metagenome TaxID=408172 RepID=A0A383C5D9_9ZZZZ
MKQVVYFPEIEQAVVTVAGHPIGF